MVGFFGQCADTGRRSVDRGRLTEQNVARGRFDEKEVMHVSGSNRSNADGLYGVDQVCDAFMRHVASRIFSEIQGGYSDNIEPLRIRSNGRGTNYMSICIDLHM